MAFFKKTPQSQPKPAGKFIVIEGTDGEAKTLQIELLAKTLASYDYDGLVFEFPQYSQMSSELLSKYLAGDYGDLNPEAISILYALDRFDAGFKIREHLSQGRTILANRYVDSNAAHQGGKILDRNDRIKFYKWLDNLEYTIFNIPKPDLTIILHSPTNADLPITGTEQAYLEVAKLFPNTKLIECSENNQPLTSQEIHAKVWELVRRIVLKNNSF